MPNLTDPRTKYPHQDFPAQTQTTPALQSRMTPQPDCGETSYVGHGQLQGRRALITGGDSGIGRAAAIAYAREGADVAIQFFPGEEADANAVKALIEAAGRQALLLPADLRDDEAATQLVAATVAAFDGLDLLVLNAAQQIQHDSLAELPIKQVEATFKVNIISMFATVQAALPHLKPGSAIITTTSIQGFAPSPNLMDYAASKAAITNFTLALAKTLTPQGIRVNGVAPGPIWTPLQLDHGQPAAKIPQFGQDSPLGRAGMPAELAPVYVLLAADAGSFITGQIYGVTGGAPINP